MNPNSQEKKVKNIKSPRLSSNKNPIIPKNQFSLGNDMFNSESDDSFLYSNNMGITPLIYRQKITDHQDWISILHNDPRRENPKSKTIHVQKKRTDDSNFNFISSMNDPTIDFFRKRKTKFNKMSTNISKSNLKTSDDKNKKEKSNLTKKNFNNKFPPQTNIHSLIQMNQSKQNCKKSSTNNTEINAAESSYSEISEINLVQPQLFNQTNKKMPKPVISFSEHSHKIESTLNLIDDVVDQKKSVRKKDMELKQDRLKKMLYPTNSNTINFYDTVFHNQYDSSHLFQQSDDLIGSSNSFANRNEAFYRYAQADDISENYYAQFGDPLQSSDVYQFSEDDSYYLHGKLEEINSPYEFESSSVSNPINIYQNANIYLIDNSESEDLPPRHQFRKPIVNWTEIDSSSDDNQKDVLPNIDTSNSSDNTCPYNTVIYPKSMLPLDNRISKIKDSNSSESEIFTRPLNSFLTSLLNFSSEEIASGQKEVNNSENSLASEDNSSNTLKTNEQIVSKINQPNQFPNPNNQVDDLKTNKINQNNDKITNEMYRTDDQIPSPSNQNDDLITNQMNQHNDNIANIFNPNNDNIANKMNQADDYKANPTNQNDDLITSAYNQKNEDVIQNDHHLSNRNSDTNYNVQNDCLHNQDDYTILPHNDNLSEQTNDTIIANAVNKKEIDNSNSTPQNYDSNFEDFPSATNSTMIKFLLPKVQPPKDTEIVSNTDDAHKSDEDVKNPHHRRRRSSSVPRNQGHNQSDFEESPNSDVSPNSKGRRRRSLSSRHSSSKPNNIFLESDEANKATLFHPDLENLKNNSITSNTKYEHRRRSHHSVKSKDDSKNEAEDGHSNRRRQSHVLSQLSLPFETKSDDESPNQNIKKTKAAHHSLHSSLPLPSTQSPDRRKSYSTMSPQLHSHKSKRRHSIKPKNDVDGNNLLDNATPNQQTNGTEVNSKRSSKRRHHNKHHNTTEIVPENKMSLDQSNSITNDTNDLNQIPVISSTNNQNSDNFSKKLNDSPPLDQSNNQLNVQILATNSDQNPDKSISHSTHSHQSKPKIDSTIPSQTHAISDNPVLDNNSSTNPPNDISKPKSQPASIDLPNCSNDSIDTSKSTNSQSKSQESITKASQLNLNSINPITADTNQASNNQLNSTKDTITNLIHNAMKIQPKNKSTSTNFLNDIEQKSTHNDMPSDNQPNETQTSIPPDDLINNQTKNDRSLKVIDNMQLITYTTNTAIKTENLDNSTNHSEIAKSSEIQPLNQTANSNPTLNSLKKTNKANPKPNNSENLQNIQNSLIQSETDNHKEDLANTDQSTISTTNSINPSTLSNSSKHFHPNDDNKSQTINLFTLSHDIIISNEPNESNLTKQEQNYANQPTEQYPTNNIKNHNSIKHEIPSNNKVNDTQHENPFISIIPIKSSNARISSVASTSLFNNNSKKISQSTSTAQLHSTNKISKWNSTNDKNNLFLNQSYQSKDNPFLTNQDRQKSYIPHKKVKDEINITETNNQSSINAQNQETKHLNDINENLLTEQLQPIPDDIKIPSSIEEIEEEESDESSSPIPKIFHIHQTNHITSSTVTNIKNDTINQPDNENQHFNNSENKEKISKPNDNRNEPNSLNVSSNQLNHQENAPTKSHRKKTDKKDTKTSQLPPKIPTKVPTTSINNETNDSLNMLPSTKNDSKNADILESIRQRFASAPIKDCNEDWDHFSNYSYHVNHSFGYQSFNMMAANSARLMGNFNDDSSATFDGNFVNPNINKKALSRSVTPTSGKRPKEKRNIDIHPIFF